MKDRFKSRWAHREAGEIVILDNRDSFVFNLAHRLWQSGAKEMVVVRSDRIDVEELDSWRPAAIVLSPGPGRPEDAGISVDAVRAFSGKIPILGVCLGHQAIGSAFGASVSVNGAPCHGKATEVSHDGLGLHRGLPAEFAIGRYHSLHVESPLEAPLVESAWSDGFVMGLRHSDHPTFGIQYHPESVLTGQGLAILENFVGIVSDRTP